MRFSGRGSRSRLFSILLAFALLFGFALDGIRFYVGAFGPSFPLVGEFLGFFGLSVGEVVEFGAVGFEIVEFPGAGASLADEFEVADADGGVAFVFPEEGIA